ncbi:hypothetical protein EYZ11_010118 [Aspergillus tanneri]|uniref:Structural maintenance of chromosomes protein 5 n=1 Tax=Aspergillus tanneri TaxID=1220188 RepID=A0A4S3J668_9EURO|nr:hypothetical protein EYZ11_010118 [Aspergillus tanneri]
MPSIATVPSRRQRSEDDDNSDGTSSVSTRDPTPASQVSNTSKRIRLETVEDAVKEEDTDESTSGDSDSESPEDSVPTSAQRAKAAASHGPNANALVPGGQNGVENEGYKPGAIVRIKVTDFVTYTSAEFFPGPKLNMVIGPNGTGKSTLVCAICLGLGWGPQHLGRAKDPGEFVKHGCREATIEIELAGGPKFRRNPIVCRTIKREGNKSSFMLNGKPASRTQVLKFAQSFSIQIDNLCQFLPQDKVSEFAALTPVELLHSTQRAAAEPEMIEWHDNLKKLRVEQKKLQADNQGDKDLLTNLQNRQEMQRADVERMRQRAQIKRKIEMLELVRPVTKYKESHAQYKELKRKKDTISRELDMLKTQLEPALRAVNAKQDYCVRLDKVIEHKKRGVDRADRKASEVGKSIERYEDSTKDLDKQIDAEKKSSANYKQEATKIQQAINKLTRQLNEEPVNFDVDWYNEQIVSILYNGQKAYKWVLENQNKFEKEVFGPPVVTCSLKDPKYADAIESLLQRTDFTAFTTQSRNDFRTLQKALNIEMKLHDISIRTSSAPLENFQPPFPADNIKAMGFNGWANDFLSGPEPVLAVLCSENRLHQTPIGLRDITDEEYTRMEKGSITSWVSGKRSYQIVRRREYGPSASTTRVRQVRQARVWTSQPVDTLAKEHVLQNISSLKEELRGLEEKMESEKAELAELGQRHNERNQERVWKFIGQMSLNALAKFPTD